MLHVEGFKYKYSVVCLSKPRLRGGGDGFRLGSEIDGWETKRNKMERACPVVYLSKPGLRRGGGGFRPGNEIDGWEMK